MKQRNPYKYRKIWEETNKACLLPGIHIHHVDGDKHNNAPDNLVACTPEEHWEYHKQMGDKVVIRGGRNFIISANNSLGRPCTEETKQKIREKLQLISPTPQQRLKTAKTLGGGDSFLVFDKNDGRLVGEYALKSGCAKDLDLTPGKVRQALQRKRHCVKQYLFIYTSQHNSGIDMIERYKLAVAAGMEQMRQTRIKQEQEKRKYNVTKNNK